MTKNLRRIYFISDGTGITVENLGQSLLTQFSDLEYKSKKYPYINTKEKAKAITKKIIEKNKDSEFRPIILSTLISDEIRSEIKKSNVFMIDFFEEHIDPLEQELGIRSNHTIGKTHSLTDIMRYDARMDAINFTLYTDDGLALKKYEDAQIIIIGISRCGKTPTCLYMSIQYGIKAANYPLVDEDLEDHKLPHFLEKYKHKIYGLSIDPKRLQTIRHKRRPNAKYSDLKQCQYEVKQAEQLFQREKIPFLYTTSHSIEEIAAHILQDKGLGNML